MSTNGAAVIEYPTFQGDAFLWGGIVKPKAGSGSTITTIAGKAQIRPESGSTLIHDFGSINFSDDGEGNYSFALSVSDTSGWPVGIYFCDLELNINNTGPLTVVRLRITVQRTVTQ